MFSVRNADCRRLSTLTAIEWTTLWEPVYSTEQLNDIKFFILYRNTMII